MINDDYFYFLFNSCLKLNVLESYWSWLEKKFIFMLVVYCYIVVIYLENVLCVINKNIIFFVVIVYYK